MIRFIPKLLVSKKSVFTTDDLAIISNTPNRDTLRKKIIWHVKKGSLIRLHKGIYTISGVEYSELELGNMLMQPSYISFETVLFKEGVIFQYDSSVYLASTNSKVVEINEKKFIFRKIKTPVLLNTSGIVREKGYSVASKERAFLDMIYLKKSYYFDNLETIDWEKCKEILPIYKSKRMEKEIHKLEQEYVR